MSRKGIRVKSYKHNGCVVVSIVDAEDNELVKVDSEEQFDTMLPDYLELIRVSIRYIAYELYKQDWIEKNKPKQSNIDDDYNKSSSIVYIDLTEYMSPDGLLCYSYEEFFYNIYLSSNKEVVEKLLGYKSLIEFYNKDWSYLLMKDL